jgi:hypothetical protein
LLVSPLSNFSQLAAQVSAETISKLTSSTRLQDVPGGMGLAPLDQGNTESKAAAALRSRFGGMEN